MVDNGQEVLIAGHCHDWVRLANQIFLDPVVRKDADVVVIGQDSVPPAANGQTLGRLAIFELEVPFLHVFPFVKGFELDV